MDDRQKIPVPRHSFLWSLNETSGEILTHVGPTEFTPSANDRIVRANLKGGFEQAAMEARPFVVARDGEYVLLDNPVVDESEEGPNGSHVPGGNKEKHLRLGTTKIIPGPCAFPMWPGQAAEVRPAHKLGPNHYLLVEVAGPIDADARYYDLVMTSAGLSSTVIDADSDGEADGPKTTGTTKLRIGQRIVVQGRHTQLFIPPTGIQVVPAHEESESPSEESDDGRGRLPPPVAEELKGLIAQVEGGMSARQFSVMKNELRHRADLSSGHKAIMLTALDDLWNKRRDSRATRPGERADRRAGRPIDPYARRAVVLGPKNFCYLFDADGNPRIVRGPARVFPGPQDTFLQRGSRRRVYDAFELGEHQALWLRIISPITKEELARRLPPGTTLEQDRYEAGDELLVRGQPSVFFPFIEAEVLKPSSREPHVGNDHDRVIIEAIGIDQKSGIYVSDLRTGMVKMVQGETSYMVDPRREEHVERRIPGEDWNLWVAHGEPHKRTTEDVVTPWALSLVVPPNEAISITSRQGRRVVIGPRNELLEYEERLTALNLSDGASKDGTSAVRTCFLRIQGGRTSDTFEVESSDFVRFRLRLQLAYEFAGDTDKWFNVEDPIKLLADVLRSSLRDAVRRRPATQLLVGFPDLVRETLFGDGEVRDFPENGMRVTAVDVLAVQIADAALSKLFDDAQREFVQLQLADQQVSRRLESTRHRDSVDAEEHEIQRIANKRAHETGRLEAGDQHELDARKADLSADLVDLQQRREQARLKAESDHELSLRRSEAEARTALLVDQAQAEAKAAGAQHEEQTQFAAAQATIEQKTAKALADADATRLAAIQAELVGALHSAADSEVMKAAANNMNLVALLGGKSPSQLFTMLLEGTPLSRTTAEMARRADTPTEGNGTPQPRES